jgi:hypothetical protein
MNANETLPSKKLDFSDKSKALINIIMLVVMIVLLVLNWSNYAFATSVVNGRIFLSVWALLIVWLIITEYFNGRSCVLVAVGLAGALIGIAVTATNWVQFTFIQWPIGWLAIASIVLVIGRYRVRM